MEWCYKESPPLKKFNTQLSACKFMTSVFWDSKGVIHVDFLPHSIAVNAQYYSNFLHNDVHQEFWKKKPGKLSKNIILLQDNAHPHTENMMKVTLATIVGWEIMNHPPYSHDLAPSNIHLFGPKKVHLGQKFQTDELKCGVLNWLHSQDKTFSATGISDLPGWEKKCVTVEGEYFEMESEFGDSGTYILFAKKKKKSRPTFNHPCYVSKVIKAENKKMNCVPE
jgi:hypothetical protein